MAIAIKSIPVLTGEAAERFIRMADENEASSQRTVIPVELKESIKIMMEKSKRIVVNAPQRQPHA